MKKITVAIVSLIAIASWTSSLFLSVNIDNADSVVSAKQNTPRLIAQKPAEWESRFLSATKKTKSTIARNQKAEPKVLGIQAYNVNELSREQALSLAKPGVVSILNWMEGSVSVPDFDVDLKTFSLIPRNDLRPYTLNATDGGLDDYGSGFVVNPNGYIITNSHVVSKALAQDKILAEVNKHWNTLYKSEQDALSDKDFTDYNNFLDTKYGKGDVGTAKINQEIDAQVANYLKNYLQDNLTSHVVVIDRSLKGQTLQKGGEVSEIYHNGLPAKVISFDPDFKNSGKDVALLKIDEQNVPSLSLGSSDELASGNKVFIFGYPYNAQISNSDWFEPTLTEGIIGAIKQNQGQKIIQLDNKISPGSSGGPLLDSHGNVIGIVTYETGSKVSGDNFGFALPIELAKKLMDEYLVTNDLGTYGSNLLLGYANQDQSYCQKALDYFNSAKQTNIHFPVDEELAVPIKACENLISGNLSKDSPWAITRLFYIQHPLNAALLTLLVLVLLGFGYRLVLYLIDHLRKQKTFAPVVPMPKITTMG